MADEIDHTSEMQDVLLSAALSNRVIYQGVSATHCEECDSEIPEGRREALPGIKICIFCAERASRLKGRR